MSLRTQGFRFGEFLLDTKEVALFRAGEPVAATPKALRLLLALVENHGHIVDKEKLLQNVWSDSFVEEGNLTFTISVLRKILGDSRESPRFIETVPRRGYRFIGDISVVEPGAGPTTPEGEYKNGTALVRNGRRRLFGREREISMLGELLRRDETRLITLTGAGGAGKTSLARVASENTNADFPDGSFFIELAAITDPELLPAAIARTLDLKESGDDTLARSLQYYLKIRRVLLVLDNFEQIVTAAPFVADLVAATEHLKVLVTSRAALRCSGENELVVPMLACPPAGAAGRKAGKIQDYPSIRLFTERARASNPHFELVDANAASVAGICARLDGLPLAIELAAARVMLLSPASILERLKRPLQVLKSTDPDLPARQQTMRAAIAWSYDLLGDEEKALFRRLAVFAGGFTVNAAEEVCGAPGGPDVLDGLEALLQSSLLRRIDETSDDGRMQFLETIREFSAERLAEDPHEESEIRRRHFEYFLALAKTSEQELMGPDQARLLDEVDAQRHNFRAALDWARRSGDEREMKLAASLGALWLFRGYLSEGIDHLKGALDRCRDAPLAQRAKALTWLGQLIWVKGDYEETIRVCLLGLRLAREVDYPIFAAQALFFLGMSYWYRFNDRERAVESLEESLSIYRTVKYDAGIVFTLVVLAAIHQTNDDLAAAERLLDESVDVAARTRNNLINSIAKVNYGRLEIAKGNLERAKGLCRESLRLRGELSDRWGLVQCLEPLAVVALKEGNAERAACILGAIDLQLESLGASPPLIFRADHDPTVEATRELLDPDTFSRLNAEGRRLTTPEVVALAMEDTATAAG